MDRKKAVIIYLTGFLGQRIVVCIAVWLLRGLGIEMGYSSITGFVAIAIGGISSAIFNKTQSLWMCVIGHSLINVFSQLSVGGNQIVAYICRVIIVVVAIVISMSANKNTVKRMES